MMDKLVDFVGVNLEEGTIDPNVFEYVKFRGQNCTFIGEIHSAVKNVKFRDKS